MADIIDFSTLRGAGAGRLSGEQRPAAGGRPGSEGRLSSQGRPEPGGIPSGLAGVPGAGAAGGAGEVVGRIGGAAGPDKGGAHEYPVPQAGQQVRLVYPAGAELPAGLPAESACLAIELTTHADGQADFLVTVPADAATPLAREAQTSLARTAGVDARDLSAMERVRASLGQAAVDRFVATFVQRHFLQLAVQRTGVATYLSPDTPDAHAPRDGEPYAFHASVLLRPQVRLTSYDPVEVAFPEKEKVSSKDVSEYLAHMADQMATFQEDPTRDKVVDGDFVTVTMEATYDGKPFSALTRRGVLYEVGSGTLPDEFDANVTGMAPRQRKTFSVSVPMPDDKGGLAYAVVQVKLTLEHIDRKVPATINDAWVAANAPQAGTLLGLRGQIRDALERDAENAYRGELASRCAAELAKRLTPVPGEAYVRRMRDQLMDQFALGLANQGVDVQAYLSQPGFDRAGFQAHMTRQAADELRQGLALTVLAEHLGLTVSQDDLRAAVSSLAPGNERQALRELTQSGQLEQVRGIALRANASEWLIKHAKDASGPKLQLV